MDNQGHLLRLKNKLSSILSRILLSQPRLRVHIIEEVKKKYFDLLNVEIELSNGLKAPITYLDSLASFKEIFLDGCYSWIKPDLKCNRWLDIGCNNGFFTLNLVNQKLLGSTNENLSALLIDGDKRSQKSTEKINRRYPDYVKTDFIWGVVGPKKPHVEFLNLEAMYAHIQETEDADTKGISKDVVPVIQEEELLKRFAPPYDLVKIDIEGAEIDFLENYPTILRETTVLIIEWHSWNFRDISMIEFEKRLGSKGFSIKRMSYLSWEDEGKTLSCADYFCERI